MRLKDFALIHTLDERHSIIPIIMNLIDTPQNTSSAALKSIVSNPSTPAGKQPVAQTSSQSSISLF